VTTPFIIFASPRSRTYWLSRFLSYGDWTCDHEVARYVRGLDDIRSWLQQPYVGTVETAAAAFWRLVPPGVRVVVVRRPVAEVIASLLRAGVAYDHLEAMQRHDMRLTRIAQRVPGVLSVAYADLSNEATCAAVFEHCLQRPHDHNWWARVSAVNLQINLPAMMRYAVAHAPQLRAATAVCRRKIISDLRRTWRKDEARDGVTIQEEPYDVAWRDAEALMAEHCVEVGEASDNYLRKNVALFQRLSDVGAWQIMTARMNGRMLGYLSAVIGPSLEHTDPICAQLSLFVAKDGRGLNLHTKLQAATIEAARSKGVREVFMRAGTRGAGKRLGVLYRRFGAEDDGQTFRLRLEAA
jgi:GNAT superfamily N-acetyltransferase